MPVADLLIFLAIVAAGAYVQTVTGFAFGLIVISGMALTGILPLPEAAVFVSVLSLTNTGQMLAIGRREIRWRPLALTLAASIPAMAAGYALLDYLASDRLDALRIVLGGLVMASSLQLLARPAPLSQVSPGWTFGLFGALSGIMSGLFSVGGPPLVYHMFRQPWSVLSVKVTLAASFGIISMLRLAVVAMAGGLPPLDHMVALIGIPVVTLATSLAHRAPPPLTPAVLRAIVFGLLFLSGLSVAGPAVVHVARAVAMI